MLARPFLFAAPRQRQHRARVRRRRHLRQRTTRAKNKRRRVLANSNADRPDLFTRRGKAFLRGELPVSPADRFVVEQFLAEPEHGTQQLAAADR